MRVKIEIDTATFVRFLLVTTGFVAAIFIIFKIASALTLIFISAFLALALNSPVSKLMRRLPGESRVGATALAYLVVLAILGVFVFMAAPPVIQQTNNFVQNFPTYVEDASSQKSALSDFIVRYDLEDEVDKFARDASSQASLLIGGVGGSLVVGLSSVLSGALTLLTVLVLTFLMLIEGPKWVQRAWGLYRDPHRLERHKNITQRMYRVITGYVNGQLLVAAIAGSCTLVTILILATFFAVPTHAALPLAGIIFLTGLIPMVGATIGAIIVIAVLLFNDVSAALIFLIYFLIYQQIENNFIQPVVQARTVELSALAVFSAIIIGVTLFGILGGVVAIPIAGCVRVLIVDYIEHHKRPASGRLAKHA